MIEALKKWLDTLLLRVPPQLSGEFARHCAQKNNARFSVLPIFNIITQVACFFIYLYIYPATFPEKPRLDPLAFTLFSVFYIAANLLFIILFSRLRHRTDSPNYLRNSHITVLVFLVGYVLMESFETVMEVQISGNIYRFLATFFVAAFLPVLRRHEKAALLVLYTLCVELGFSLLVSQGYSSTNRFQEIILLFLVACLIVSNITYNATVRTFMLQHNLLAVNEELRDANERLERLAVVDPLTGISNRRAFDQYMSLAWRSAFRDGRYLSVAMLDIDDFKIYNDTYGHQKGDECLVTVAACINGYFQRETDMVARYGGEEFIVLSVQDDIDAVRALVEKMQRGVRELQIENKNGSTGGHVTASVGLAAAVPAAGLRYETLIKRADDALYEAKRAEKNCVRTAPPLPAPAPELEE